MDFHGIKMDENIISILVGELKEVELETPPLIMFFLLAKSAARR